jgi:endonuclease/exonuclease/phosphatase family metal-dependent hydrolase
MQIRIATINVWGLPEPLSTKRRFRLQTTIDIIRKQNLDIIGLQEVWLKQDIFYLLKQLPGFSIAACPNPLFNRSGLVLLSRFPLENVSLTPFNQSWFNFEFPSRKGMLKASASINGTKLQLVNTHLYYSRSSKQRIAQMKQARQLAESLHNDPTILFGDFNMEWKQLELPDAYRCISETEQPSIIHTNPYSTSRFNKYNSNDRLPDYLFANFPSKLVKSFCVTDPLVSDHYPVVSIIEIP